VSGETAKRWREREENMMERACECGYVERSLDLAICHCGECGLKLPKLTGEEVVRARERHVHEAIQRIECIEKMREKVEILKIKRTIKLQIVAPCMAVSLIAFSIQCILPYLHSLLHTSRYVFGMYAIVSAVEGAMLAPIFNDIFRRKAMLRLLPERKEGEKGEYDRFFLDELARAVLDGDVDGRGFHTRDLVSMSRENIPDEELLHPVEAPVMEENLLRAANQPCTVPGQLLRASQQD
jgi:hypothetical protein